MNRILVLGVLSLTAFAGCKHPTAATTPPSDILNVRNAQSKRQVLGYAVSYGDINQSLNMLKKHGDKMSMIAAYWYSLYDDGTVGFAIGAEAQKKASPPVFDPLRKQGKKVLALVNYLPHTREKDPAKRRTKQFDAFLKPEVRKKAIESIANLGKLPEFDGVNIDLENMSLPDNKVGDKKLMDKIREGHTEIVKGVRAALGPNKIIIVSVMPIHDLWEGLSYPYDYAAMAPHIDAIQLMVYDKHWRGAPKAGPISPFNWVERNIIETKKLGVPANKIMIGIANYCRDWPNPPQPQNPNKHAEDFGDKACMEKAKAVKAKMQWDSEAKVPYFTYKRGQENRIVYFESPESNKLKMQLVERYDLQGIGVWRLGWESDEFWQTVNATLAM